MLQWSREEREGHELLNHYIVRISNNGVYIKRRMGMNTMAYGDVLQLPFDAPLLRPETPQHTKSWNISVSGASIGTTNSRYPTSASIQHKLAEQHDRINNVWAENNVRLMSRSVDVSNCQIAIVSGHAAMGTVFKTLSVWDLLIWPSVIKHSKWHIVSDSSHFASRYCAKIHEVFMILIFLITKF